MKKVYLIIIFCCLSFAGFAASRISTIGTATIAATNICTGTASEIFALTDAQSTTSTTTTAFKFVTTGTYTTSDITDFALYSNSTNTLAGATFIGSVTATAAGTQTITYATLTMTASTTKYYIIAANVSSGATAGHTVAINAITNAATTPFTFSGTAPTYAASTAGASGSFTVIASPSPITASTSFSVCAGSSITLNDVTTPGTWSSSNSALASVSAGVVQGIGAGSPIIYFSVGTCSVSATVRVGALATGITGSTAALCAGASTTLSVVPTTATGGTWSSSNVAISTVSSAGGSVLSISAGIDTISYITPGCAAVTYSMTVNIQPSAITGISHVCAPGTTALSVTPTPGTWTSSVPANATIDPVSGIVQYIANGGTTITYTLADGCFSTFSVTAVQAPGPISGLTSFCAPIVTTLLSQNFNTGMTGQVGGTWTTVNSAVNGYNWNILSTSYGDVSITGGGAGFMETDANEDGSTINTQLISPSFSTVGYSSLALSFNYYCRSSSSYDTYAEIDYSLDGSTWTTLYNYFNTTTGATTLNTSASFQSIPLPAGALGQPTVYLRWNYVSDNGWYWALDNVVVSNTIPSSATLTDAVSGATWTSSVTAVATIGATTGILTGITAGVTTISYTNVCGTATQLDTVIGTPATITGNTTPLAFGAVTTFSDVTTNGAWSSGSPAIASVSATTGIVTGISAGTATISYSTGCGNAATQNITVVAPTLSVSPIYVNMGPSPAGITAPVQSFTLSGTYLLGAPGNITLTSTNTDYLISIDGSTWLPTLTVPFSSYTLAATPIYVQFTPSVTGTDPGSVTLSGASTTTPPTVILGGTGATPCSAAPGIPVSMTFAGNTTTSTNVSFTPTGTPDGYVIVESTVAFTGAPAGGHTYTIGESLGNGIVIDNSYTTSPTYPVTGLSGNTQYYFTAIPFYGGSLGTCIGGPVYPTGTQLSASTITCPNTPSSLSATAVTAASAVLNWLAPSGTGSSLTYSIDISTSSAFSTVISGSPFNAGSAVSYTVTGLPANTTLYFRVSAISSCTGIPSAAVSFTTATSYSTVTIASGFNGDAICEGTGNPLDPTTPTQSFGSNAFDGGGYSFVAYNYDYAGNLPTTGSFPASNIVSSSITPGLNWQIGPYAGNNVLRMPGGTVGSGAVHFTPPVYASEVFLVGSASNNGVNVNGITINYRDGSTQSFAAWDLPDWFSTAVPAAVPGIGRINVGSGGASGTAGVNPSLFQDVLLNSTYTQPISSISFTTDGTTASNSYVGIFGVSIRDGILKSSVTTLPDFGNVSICGSGSAAQTFTIYGAQLYPASGNIEADAPDGYQVSSDGITWDVSALFPYTGNTLGNTTVYVRCLPTEVGATPGTITFFGGGVNNNPVINVSGTGVGGLLVAPSATASFGPVTEFTSSAILTYTMSGSPVPGTPLTPGNVTVTSDNGDFLVSPDGTTWATSYTVPNGTSFSSVIYIQYTPTVTTTEIGNITITGTTITCAIPGITCTGSGSSTPCLAPPVPSALTITGVTDVTATIGFTPSGTPDGYMLVQGTVPFSGTPVAAHTYSVGESLGGGTVVSYSYTTAPVYPLTGLTGNTNYYFTVIPFNGGAGATCGGGPLYSTGPQLTGSVTTCPSAPVINTVTATITSITINWASAAGGNALPVTYKADVSATSDFLSPVAGSPFVLNDPTTSLTVSGLTSAVTYYFRIKDSTSICTSGYTGGNKTTGSYCTPTFEWGCGGYYTSNVTFGSSAWNGTSGSCGTSDYTTTQVFTVTAGVPAPLSVTNQAYCGTGVWVDFTNTGNFAAAGDNIFAPTYNGGDIAVYTTNVTVPTTIPTGLYRMRVISAWGTDCTSTTSANGYGPCGVYDNSSGGGGAFQDFSLYVINPVLTTTASSLASFGIVPTCSNSGVETFTVNGTGLYPSTGNIIATAPSGGFQLSSDGTTWNSTVTYPYTSGLLASTVYVRFSPTATGTPSGNITFTGGAVATPPTVSVAATASGTTLIPASIAFFGPVPVSTISTAQVYTLTGSNLTAGNITVATNNPDFQVSPDGSTYYTTNYTFANGATLAATPIYIIFSPTVVATETATITVTSPTGCVQTIIASGSGAVGCSAPGVPTAISFPGTNSAGTGINFTPSGSPDGYLVLQGFAPFSGAPVLGTVYSAGSIIGTGTVVGVFSVTTLPLTITSSAGVPIIPNTAYNITVIPFNGGPTGTCTGGPVYAASYLAGTYTTCPGVPVGVTSSAVTGTGFTLSWTAPAEGSADAVTYGIDVSTDNTFATGVSSYVTSALTYSVAIPYGSTTYYYRLHAITAACNSTYTTPGSISAGCGITPLPYAEGFESITTNNTLPSCMAATNLGGANTTWTAATGSYGQAPHSGSKFASFYYYNNSTFADCNDWFFTPEFNFVAGYNYQVSFWYVTDGYSGWLKLNAAYGSAQTAAAMTTTVGTQLTNVNNTTYAQYTGTFTATSTGNDYVGIYCNSNGIPYYLTIDDISVKQLPTLIATPASVFVGSVNVGYSGTGSYSLSGNGLSGSGNITVTAPAGYLVATSIGGVYSSSVSVAYSAGILTSTPVYVQFSPTVTGTLSGTVTCVGGGASVGVPVSGVGVVPVLTAIPSTLNMGPTIVGVAAPVQSFTVAGAFLTGYPGNITLTSTNPTDYQISNDGGTSWHTTVTVPYTSGTLTATPIFVQYIASSIGVSTGTVTLTGGGAATPPVVLLNGNGASSCATPTVAPTSMTFSGTNATSTSVGFTTTGTQDGYLLVKSTSALTVTPTTMHNYNVGDALGSGTVIGIYSASPSYAVTGLTGNTLYYFTVIPFNGGVTGTCGGGPLYGTSLSGSVITCPAAPTSPVTSSLTSSGFVLSWTSSLGGAAASSLSYSVDVSTNNTFTAPVTGSPFTVTDPVTTVTIGGLSTGTTYYYRVSAIGSGTCSSPSTGTGTITTTLNTYNTVALSSGFNEDIIANGTANPANGVLGVAGTSTGSYSGFDNVGNAYISSDYAYSTYTPYPGQSLPVSGALSSLVTSGLPYQLAGYSTDNALVLAAATVNTGTLTLTTPQYANQLYIIGSGGSSGTSGANCTFTINYADGTSQTSGTINYADWYNGTPIAVANIGRVNVTTGAVDGYSATGPNLYEHSLALTDLTSKVTSIVIKTTGGGGYLGIMAVSARTGALYASASSLPSFGSSTLCGTSSVQTFTISGSSLYPASTGTVAATASAGYQVSRDGITWGSRAVYTVSATAALAGSTVYVRFSPIASGPVSGTITFAGAGINNAPTVTLSGNGVNGSITGAATICQNDSVTLSDIVAGGTWSNGGSAFASVSTGGVVTGLSGGTALITYTYGCVDSVYTVSIPVNPAPAAYSVTGTGSYCAGSTGIAIGLNTSGIGVNYQLYNGVTAVGSSVAGNGSAISFGTYTAPATYTVVATNATTGCISNMSGNAAITITPLPTAYNVTGTGSYCAGGTGLAIGLDNSAVGVNYQLYNGAASVGSVVSGSGSAISFGTYTAAATYTVVAANVTGGCANNMNGNATISITPLPVAYSVTGTGSYCAGGTGVAIGLSSSDLGVNYQLFNGAVAVGSLVAGSGSAISFGTYTASSTYTVVATNAAAGCTNNMSGSATITITPLPTAYNVTGTGSYCSGTTGLAIGLDNSDVGINYQLFNGATAVGGIVAGSGSAISFGTFTAAATYTVVATNAATGCTADMNGSATITITPLPVAYNVTGTGSYCPGGSGLSIGLDNSAVGVTYQLYNGAVAVGSPVTGTGSAISFGTYTAAATYTAVATNAATGCTNAMNGNATISITPVPTAYNVTGTGSYCSGGTGVAIGLDNSAIGVNYQLYDGAVAVGTAVAGTGSAISFGLYTTAATYTVVATSGCSSNMNGSATISVNPIPVAYNVTGTGSYCSGGAGLAIGLDNSAVGINYQLYNGATATGSAVAGNGLAISFGTYTAAATYTVVATNATTGCTNAMNGGATITITPLPAAYTVTGTGSYCAGGAGLAIGLNNSAVGVNYQLYNGATAIGGLATGTGSAISFGTYTTAATYSVVATSIAGGCSSNMSGSATITITPLPTAYNVTGTGSYCAGTSGVSIGLDNSAVGVNYQLYDGASAVGSSVSGTGSAISFGTYTAAATYTAVATNISGGCANNMNGSATITINPLPTAYNVTGTGSYCTGGSGLAIGLDNSTVGVNYQLYNGATATGSVVAGTGSAISFGTYTAAATYTVVATNIATGCTNAMNGSATITITPLPTAYNVTGTGSYCAGSAGLAIGLDNSVVGVNYQLYDGATAVGSAVSGTGAPITFGTYTAATTYTVVATSVSGGCSSNMNGAATVTITPLPIAYNVTGTGSYCAGGTGLAIGLDNSATGVNYQLYNGATAVGSSVSGTGSAISFGTYTAAATYTVVATNISGGCTNAMSGGATITITPLPTAYNVTGTGSYCAGGTGLSVGLDNSDIGVNYQLYDGAAAVGSSVSGTGSAISFGTYTTATTYTVVATSIAGGCSSNMSGSATITITALPTAYNVTGTGSYCAGSDGLAIGLDNSAIGVNYQLYDGATAVGSAVAGSGSAISFGTYTTATTYTVVATNVSGGCSSDMSGSATITINPLPTAYNVTGTGSYCAGGAGIAIGLDNSDAGVSYQLFEGGSGIGSAVTGSGSAITFGVYSAAATYSVVAINTTTSCSSAMSGSATITINSVLTPSVSIASSATTVCAGTTVTITPTAFNGGTSPAYTWYVNSILASSGTTYSYVPSNGDLVSAILTSDVSCPSVDTAISDTVTITVNPVLVPSVSITSSADTVCAGTAITFTVTSANGGASPSYQWQVNGVNEGTGVTYTYTPANGDTVRNILTSSATCATPALLTSDSIVIVVNPVITPSLTVYSSATATGALCAGTAVSYTAAVANGGSSPVYQWQVDGTTVSAGNTYSFTPVNGDTVITTVTTSAACATTLSVSDTIILTVNPVLVPSVTISSGAGDTVCVGTTVTLTATAVNGGTSPAYQWFVNTINVGSGSTYSYIPVNGDIVVTSLTSSALCAVPDSAVATLTFAVDSIGTPVVSIGASPGTTITSGTSDTLTATITSGGGAAPAYQWYINGTAVSGATSAVFVSDTLTGTDSISCEVLNTDRCGSSGFSSVIISVTNVGVQQITLSGIDVQLVPNPNNGTFTIKGTLGTTQDAPMSLDITDMLGQSVYRKETIAQKGIVNETIQLSNSLANGMYLLNLRSGNNNIVFHFVLKQ